jgi:hypothetical protein
MKTPLASTYGDTAKAVPRGKFIAMSAHSNRTEISQINKIK